MESLCPFRHFKHHRIRRQAEMDGKFLPDKLSSTSGLDDKPDLDGDFWPNRNFKPHPIWRQAGLGWRLWPNSGIKAPSDMATGRYGWKILARQEINHCPGREAPPGHPEHPGRANKPPQTNHPRGRFKSTGVDKLPQRSMSRAPRTSIPCKQMHTLSEKMRP